MVQISIISALDGSEWGLFLSKQIEEFGKVAKYILHKTNNPNWEEMNLDVNCIILTPEMLESNKNFIQKSTTHLQNPIIVLCGVSRRDLNRAVHCKYWRQCRTLQVACDEESTTKFYRAIKERIEEQKTSKKSTEVKTYAVTLIPDTIIQKANQSCVLMFDGSISGEVAVSITGSRNKLIATKKDTQTYVINIPEITEGDHELSVYVSGKLIPSKLSLSVINLKPRKCPCDYLCQILGSKDLHTLDQTITNFMEDDYSNRLFYSGISKPNPDFPELPTVLHFATKHGMCNVLKHLLTKPGAKDGLTIRNNKKMDCIDIARSSESSSTLVPFLEKEIGDEGLYIDMTQNQRYLTLK